MKIIQWNNINKYGFRIIKSHRSRILSYHFKGENFSYFDHNLSLKIILDRE